MNAEPLKILITDDDLGDRKQLRRSIKKAGMNCDITEAQDMEEALEACKNSTFDCAFLDNNMPGRTGLESIAELSKISPYTAIILVTGQGDETIASEAIKQGASEYIPKRLISAASIDRIINNSLDKKVLQRKIDDQQSDLMTFSRVLAHDLKSPLSQLRLLSNMIVQGAKDGNTEKLEEIYKILDKTVDHSLSLIETLQEYNSALDADIKFETISMQSVMTQVIEILTPVITEKGACITFDNLPEIDGNAPQLVQLIQNIVGNGLKYCRAEIPRVHISFEDQNDFWCFICKDNGIGISEEYISQIFEPFQRLHGQKEFTGTGLGLATCKKIVERHGGKIWCISSEGEGSTFYFTISKAIVSEQNQVA